MFTLRVTDQQIRDWQDTVSSSKLCPLSTAALIELEARGTHPTRMYLANIRGYISYKIGDYTYRLVVRRSERRAMADFINAIDHRLRTRRRVFHFQAEQDRQSIYS